MTSVRPRKRLRAETNTKSQEQSLRTNDRPPTAKELAELIKFKARSENTPTVKLRTSTEIPGKLEIHYDVEEFGLAILMNAIGTADLDFYNGLLSQLRRVTSKRGEIDKGALDFMLSVIKGIKPEDQVEAMLAAQVAAVHTAAMNMVQRLTVSETILEQESAERGLNKLMRTFACQMETLKRYRTNGPHVVQHVSVADGGQAVVGNVTHSMREVTRSESVASRSFPANANGHANGASVNGHANGASANGHANGPTANGHARDFAQRPSLRPRLPNRASLRH